MRKIFAVCAILALAAAGANAELLAEYSFGMNGLNNSGTAGAAANGTALGGWAATPDNGSATANAAYGGWGTAMSVGGVSSTTWLTSKVTNQLTISLWSNWVQQTGWTTFASTFHGDGTNPGFSFGYKTGGSGNGFYFQVGGVTTGWNGLYGGDASAPTNGLWHHYAAVLTGSAAIFYIDGVEIIRQNASGNVNFSGAYDLLIGNSPAKFLATPSYSWHARSHVDDVRIYNNGLSLAEIQAEFAAGRTAAFIPEPTTMALFGLGALGLIRRKRA